jgi:sugar/nucleoside kinase (ribokinase family)
MQARNLLHPPAMYLNCLRMVCQSGWPRQKPSPQSASPLHAGGQSVQRELDAVVDTAGAFLTEYCKLAVFTLGSRGAVAMGPEGRVASCHACDVAVADTIGAGDAFCGGFLAAYMQHAPVHACLQMGCDVGGEVVQHVGAQLPHACSQRLQSRLQGLLQGNDLD